MPRIRTRVLFLSDTQALPYTTSAVDLHVSSDFAVATTGYRAPLPSADVALHCGNLTRGSTTSEFRTTLKMLRGLRAPLKIIMPGNYDRVLDEAWWNSTIRHDGQAALGLDRFEVLQLLEDAKEDGVEYIGKEGVYYYPLENGAILRVYASPWTPKLGNWGFQYPREVGHDFRIPCGIDIAMTHGPPRDILDLSGYNMPEHGIMREHVGCPDLFTAVSRSRPQIHCFGDIYESWGSYLAAWNLHDTQAMEKHTTAAVAIDMPSSKNLFALSEIRPMTYWDEPATPEQAMQLIHWSKQMCVYLDLDEIKAESRGESHTLFVNASIQGFQRKPSQFPILVDMSLDKALKASLSDLDILLDKEGHVVES